MSKIAVTGGGGFLGSHLVDRLLKDGHKVTVIDNFSTGKKYNLSDHPKLQVRHANILDVIGHYFRDIDIVFHLAAEIRPQWSIEHPEETNDVNIQGTLKVLKYCHKYKIKRLVFVSSSALYGNQEALPILETAIPNCMSPYALSKLVGEQYCKLFERMYGLESNYVRPFNIYGARQDHRGGYAAAVPKFIDLLSKDEIPWITGDGKQARDYIYVDDVVELIILASKSKVFGEAFNAGSGKNVSINNLYKMIAKLMDKEVKPNYVDAVLEPRQTLGDISKAKDLLGWKPKVGLEEGLERTIEGTLNEKA